MTASATGMLFLEVCIEDYHYFRGRTSFNVPLEELWFLFNQDAHLTSHSSVAGLCMSLFYYKLKINALAILPYLNFYFVSYSMEMQRARRNGIMDPLVINEVTVRNKPDETVENIFLFLDRQHSKSGIVLPYNFK